MPEYVPLQVAMIRILLGTVFTFELFLFGVHSHMHLKVLLERKRGSAQIANKPLYIRLLVLHRNVHLEVVGAGELLATVLTEELLGRMRFDVADEAVARGEGGRTVGARIRPQIGLLEAVDAVATQRLAVRKATVARQTRDRVLRAVPLRVVHLLRVEQLHVVQQLRLGGELVRADATDKRLLALRSDDAFNLHHNVFDLSVERGGGRRRRSTIMRTLHVAVVLSFGGGGNLQVLNGGD